MLMAPYCAMLLADLGAEVIKVEPPGGDIARTIGPNYIGPHNAYFASLNRNKQSIVLDLATESGQQQLGALAAGARALITNLRPSAIRKLGLTYDQMQRWNPRIVCVAITGYGLEGPYTERPAYDYAIQALTGVMALTGDPAGPPTKAGFSVVDNSTALMAAVGLLAKLVERTGGQVDIAMYDAMLSQLNYLASAWLNAAEPARRYPHSAHPYIVPAQNFATQDGWVALFITHDNFWRVFCEEIGHPDWVADARFATMASRVAHREEVLHNVAAVLATQTTRTWLERLGPLGVVIAEVETLENALASENAVARGMVVEMPTADGVIRAVGNPIKNVGVSDRYVTPPLLDQHDALVGPGRPA